jgi:hypothetical protein
MMDTVRNANAPAVDAHVFGKNHPLYVHTNLGQDNGESLYAYSSVDPLDARARHARWPEFCGLTQSAVAPDACVSSDGFVEDSSATTTTVTPSGNSTTNTTAAAASGANGKPRGRAFRATAGASRRARRSIKVKVDDFVAEQAQALFRMATDDAVQDRYLPFGWGPGWSGVNGGTNEAGSCLAFVGSGLYRDDRSTSRCPVAVTGCYEMDYADEDGAIDVVDVAASTEYELLLAIPYLFTYQPDYANPERQVPATRVSLAAMLSPYFDGNLQYYVSSLSSTADGEALLVSLIVVPLTEDEFGGEPRNEMWLVRLQ